MIIRKQLALPLLLIFALPNAFAEYKMVVKIDAPIKFSNERPIEETTPETPTEPEFDFSEYSGIGTIDAVDSEGYIDTTNIQSMWIQRALFKQYNDHLIYLLGNRKDLMEHTSVVNLTINGDALRCVIDYKEYVQVFNQTIIGCTTTGYNGLKYSAGQKFNIEFQ